MSNNAYEEKEKPQIKVSGWRRVNRYKDKKANGKNGGFSADIYESTTSPKRVVIAYRGTDDLQDWKSSLSVGKRRQYAKAEELYDIVRNKYGKNTKIDVTGHSLGGGLAMSISLRYEGVDSYVFNASPRVFSDGQYDRNGNKFIVPER